MTTPIRQTSTKLATFKLPASEWERLEEIAERDERSVSAVLRLAVRAYLDGMEKAA